MSLHIGAQFHGTWAELSDDDRARILDSLKAAGIEWVRIDIAWSMIEPKKRGEHDLKWAVPFIDSVIEMAYSRGFKILCTFWRTPQWASGKTERNVFPNKMQDYANCLEWSAKRWASKVDAWEIWNEPNAAEFLNPPDAVKYTALLKAAYPAVKKGNPKAAVVLGGPMFVDTDWITETYAAGSKDYFDVMAVHPYQGNAAKSPSDPSTGKRERLLHTDELVRLMASNGDSHKEIWFTEFGWSTHENVPGTPAWFLGVSEIMQAKYFKDTMDLVSARYPMVAVAFWYTSRDLETGREHQDHRGLMRKDFSSKPSLKTVAEFMKKKFRDIYVEDSSRGKE